MIFDDSLHVLFTVFIFAVLVFIIDIFILILPPPLRTHPRTIIQGFCANAYGFLTMK